MSRAVRACGALRTAVHRRRESESNTAVDPNEAPREMAQPIPLLTPGSGRVRARNDCGNFRSMRLVSLGSLLAACLGLAACGAIPLGASDGPVTGSITAANMQSVASIVGTGEVHSTTCPGLDIERQERLRRIADLQTAATAELSNPPATIAHAVLRVSGAREEGTIAHGQIMQERSYLASIALAAARLGCPPAAQVDAGK
jgi:hypothetical protein